MLPFAAASVAAGHEVAVAAPHAFAPHVDAAGYPFLPFLGISSARVDKLLEASEQDPAIADHFGAQLFGGLAARAALPGIRDAIETYRPDLIVRDVAELASLVAAESCGIPEIAVFSSVHRYVCALLEDALPLLRPLGIRATSPATNSITLFPESFDPVGETPTVYRFRSGSPSARIRSPRPLVYLSYGTVLPRHADGVAALRASAGALGELAADVLVSIGGSDPSLCRGLGSNVRAQAWVDEDEVLPRADLVVCHGGGGTTLAALRAGVPLLVVPHFGDQPAIGDAVTTGGFGLCVGADGPPRPEDLRAAAGRILGDPSFAERAAKLAAEIAGLPPVEAAVPLFERLATARRPA